METVLDHTRDLNMRCKVTLLRQSVLGKRDANPFKNPRTCWKNLPIALVINFPEDQVNEVITICAVVRSH